MPRRVPDYEADRETLLIAIDSWRTTVGKQLGPAYPILQCGGPGHCVGGEVDLWERCIGTLDPRGDTIVENCNPYIDIKGLADQGLLRNAASVLTTNIVRNTTAENNPGGSFGWYVSAEGIVESFPSVPIPVPAPRR